MKRNSRKPEQLYVTMAKAIRYIREHARDQPDAATIAKAVGMSVSRFEHAFTEWVGTTPKRFLAYITKEEVKVPLKKGKSVLASAHASGLSGPGRLHDLMVTYEAVTPGEWKSGDIEITYGIHTSPFGWCIIGITRRGICYLSFSDTKDDRRASALIQDAWPAATIVRDDAVTRSYVGQMFSSSGKKALHLLIQGTNFQIKVWEALLAIPAGTTTSYAGIASAIGSPKAVRAAGTACGKNKIAYLIPCHRVLTSNGGIGGYRWGVARKEALLAWEAAKML